jgi:hypothetical protein
MARLDTQKGPSRLHVRANSRKYVRGYNTIPHTTWGESFIVTNPSKGSAAPGTNYQAEATITASNAASAALLAGLGYVAVPASAWTGSQKITIGVWDFFWNGTAWRPGNASRLNAAPTTVFPADPDITASDAGNAAKLTGEGFVAVPQTAWTTGQKITVGTYDFNWTSSAWAAGAHA